jgi:RNA methyltransferase, TrmH family
MATETSDYAAVDRFIQSVKLRDCFTPPPAAPQWMGDHIPYLGLRVLTGPCVPFESVFNSPEARVFVSGWTEIEAVLAFAPEPECDADLRAVVAATNERALRDVLLAFPRERVGFFYVGGEWPLSTMAEVLDGQVMPAREGYYATIDAFLPDRTHPMRQLTDADYDLIREQWSESVWQEALDLGYNVFVCHDGSHLQGLCFHWAIGPDRHMVHGLQAVASFSTHHAESMFSAATESVLKQGKVPVCDCNLSNATDYLRVIENVGYQRYYRVDSFLGIKRGSGRFVAPALDPFYRGQTNPAARQAANAGLGEGRTIARGKDPIVSQYRDLMHVAGRRAYAQCVAEGLTLVQRAIDDGLLIESIIYTAELLHSPEGLALLQRARQAGIHHYRASDALMGTLTSTRPLPAVIAAIRVQLRDVTELHANHVSALLVAENLQNPDNLGMVLRTADAAGVDSVVVAGAQVDPLHKHCVRAARGAVGRIPIFGCSDLPTWLVDLRPYGVHVVGTIAQASRSLFEAQLPLPVAIVVGNEQRGISQAVLDACTERVQIPMAPGQDSLNVGVATGVVLYELVRHRMRQRTS